MKRNTLSRVLSLLMVLCMVLSMVPVMAFATAGYYTLVTDASKLVAGDQVVIAAVAYDYALSTTQNSNNRGQAAITKNAADSTITAPSSDVQVLTLEAGKTSGTFAFNTGSGYLYAASSSKNYLRTETDLSENSSWSISIASDGTATIVAQGSNTRNTMQYNQTNSLFAAYGSASQKAICLYKLEVASDCDHTTEKQNDVAASCTADGYTGDDVCTKCGNTVAGGSIIPKTGHSFVDGVCGVCGLKQDDVNTYQLVSVESITEGEYVIGVEKSGKYPTVNLANSAEGGMWNVGGDAVPAVNDIISADLFADDVQVVELTGNNTDGFTISYDNGSEIVYLGYTNINTNNTLAFAAEYSNILWTLQTNDNGITYLLNTITDESGVEDHYAVSQNAGNIRAYYCTDGNHASRAYNSLYLFKKVPTAQDLCEHSFGDWTVTEAATCTENGKQVRTCSLCQLEESEYIEKLGHTVVDGVCSTCNETIYTLATTLADNDNVIIYYVAGELALTATASDSKLTGTAASVTNGHLIYTDAMAVMQVEYVDDTNFYLISADGKYLTSGQTGGSLTFADAPSLYSNWYLKVADEAEGVVYIKNTNAAYNSKAQDLEYYSGFTTYNTGTSSAYEMQLYVQAGTAACEHTWSDWTVETESTCTALGVNVRTCTTEGGCGHTQRSAIAMLGHDYTLGDTAVCANCSASLSLSTIATAKSYTANTVYYFEGIVTYVSGKNVYIEDSTGGVCVYFASAPSDIALGDQLRVCDTMTAFKGLIETTSTVAGEYYVVSSGNALPSQEVTIEALKADTTNEYLGERVVIKGATVSAVSSGSYTLSDGSNTIVIYKASNISEKVVAGSTVDVTAVVSSYNGYQLLVNPGTAATDVKKIGNYAIWADGAEVDVYVTFAEAYAALAEGQYIKLLADVGAEDAIVELAMDKDLYVDLNWCSMYVNVTANGYTIYGMDNSTDTYDNTEEYGYLVAQGATVAPVAANLSGTNYLAIDVTDEIGLEGYTAWSFHAYTVKLTYVTLDPTNDALGYRAQICGDEMVLAKVTGFGFHMGVEGGQQKTYSKTGAPTNGVFTLRLKNIMASNGGEMSIDADAFVIFGDTETASQPYSTTMKATILKVNELWASYDDAQKTATKALYTQYSTVMDAWFEAEGVTNNIAAWTPSETTV